LVAKTKY